MCTRIVDYMCYKIVYLLYGFLFATNGHKLQQQISFCKSNFCHWDLKSSVTTNYFCCIFVLLVSGPNVTIPAYYCHVELTVLTNSSLFSFPALSRCSHARWTRLQNGGPGGISERNLRYHAAGLGVEPGTETFFQWNSC